MPWMRGASRPFWLTFLLGVISPAPNLLGQAIVFLESGGQVVVEAEDFTSRVNTSSHGWAIVPGEAPGFPAQFSNHRSAGYIQVLPDVLLGTSSPFVGGGPNNPPMVDYRIRVGTPGTYRLFVRWASHDDNSDSFYANIVELNDGTATDMAGMPITPIADFYRFVNFPDTQDFATTPWIGVAGFEQTNACCSAFEGGSVWTIAAAGDYTVRFSVREDGAAIDAFVLQLDTLPAPTLNGPPPSATVPDCVTANEGVPLFTDSGQALGDGFTWKALVGDIDNDGDADVVSLEHGFHKVQVYFNDGHGVFSFSAAKSFQRTTDHRSGALVDLDDDGNLDLVIGGDGSAAGVFVYSGDGTGGFTQLWSHTWSFAQIDAVTVGDVDGNGSLDVVAVGFISDEESVQVCLNDGVAAYMCGPVVSDISQATDAVLVDLDNDSDRDLAVASLSFDPGGASEVKVFLNTSGVLTDTGQAATTTFPFGLAAGDLDGDGDVDLAVGNQASLPNQILLNDGTGVFTDSGQSLGAEATNSVVLGDIDLDADLDLLAINEGHGGRGYVVYSNNGSGVFTEREFGSNNFKHNGNLVDVDADGDLDLVTGDYATGASNNHAPDQVLINNLACAHIDECALGTDSCDVNATCTNTPVGFTCTCNPGYEGDGFVCSLIDLCPGDPHKTDPGVCGCGVPDSDIDGDGTSDCVDPCPNDNPDDLDGDGVCGSVDNCPADANGDQADGDGDGLGDVCDSCPLDSANDLDGDGVCGDVDNCPSVANTLQTDSDLDGVGDGCDVCPFDPADDADGDAVCGDVDNCPVVANDGQLDSDGDGAGDGCDACPFDPDNDIDGDGLCGDVDSCPHLPSGLPATLTYTGDMLVPLSSSGLAAVNLSSILTDAVDGALAGVSLTFEVKDSQSALAGQCTTTTDPSGQAACVLNLAPDVYTVSVESAQPGCPSAMDESLVVVFDPDVPRATGGGYILPDAESTLPAASPRDKANFGFIVRIDNNQAAAGNLEFQYTAADINLKSVAMTWYTVSNNSAMFQGLGTINGLGWFTFRVRATDGDQAGGQPDSFDITIWAGADTEQEPVHRAKNALSGGSVVIHRR